MSGLTIEAFLHRQDPIIDVRSPGEFAQGHIPGAHNLPLFTNEERAQVGTCYKREGSDCAVELGLDLAGPKLGQLVRDARSLVAGETVRVHCWRGGMRSGFIAYLLKCAGLTPVLLEGGYKAFRQWALLQFQVPRQLCVLGGMTGSGKTEKLHELKAQGEQVLDLEKRARHRGSSFGAFPGVPQPTVEQFENELAMDCLPLDPHQTTWIEDESRMIGKCCVPEGLYRQMKQAPLETVECSAEERLDRLCEEYGSLPLDFLVEAVERLHKKLGGLRTKQITGLLQKGLVREGFAAILPYYDGLYRYSIEKRKALTLESSQCVASAT